jgi:hypothetical protein
MGHFHDPFRAEVVYSSEPYTPPAPVEPEKPTAPTGTSREILAWVGDDKERAQLALDAELAADRPRKGLVDDLEKLV